jgi:hypothetical protein
MQVPHPDREPTPLRLLLTAFGPFLGIALLLPLLGAPAEAERRFWPNDAILAAIRTVETGDRENAPDGDGGAAIGPYQIHHAYWLDATDKDSSLGGSYQDCRRRTYATRVVTAYMQRHCPRAWASGEAQVIARIHNGGPTGATKAATLGYWQRVRKHLPG